MTIHEAYRLSELEEVLGELHSIEIIEIGLIVVIGKITVLLPEELAGKLHSLVGRRIGILRLDGYHVHCLGGNLPATSGHEPDGSVVAVHFWDHEVGSNRLSSNLRLRGE